MQAIIITAYRDPDMLCRICEKFDRDKYRIFIHIDKRYVRDFDIKRLSARGNIEIFSKYRVTWGSIKHLYAIIALMKRALAYEDVKYIHIISGQDYPIADLSGAEEDGNIYISIAPLPEERYRQYNICQSFDQRKRMIEYLYRGSVRLQKIFGVNREKLGLYKRIYKGNIWSSMPKKAAEYAVKTAFSNGGLFIKDLYTTYIPEEFFFQTIFMNSPEWRDKIVKNNMRYNDWTERDGDSSVPVTLDERDYEKIKSSGKWFARKVDSLKSDGLLYLLDGSNGIKKNELVTVVITTCKRDMSVLERALKSACDQTYENKEIIVVNDYPPYRERIEELLKAYPEVKFISNDVQSGACASRNAGIKASKGKYISPLDDDDEWRPTKLERQMAALRDGTVMVYCTNEIVLDDKPLKADPHRKYPEGDVEKDLLSANFVSGGPLLKTDTVNECGGYDPGFESCQDLDLWIRLAMRGDVRAVREPVAIAYMGHASITTGSFERRMQGWERILDKYKDEYAKHPEAYKAFTATMVREAAKKAPLGYSVKVLKKYGHAKDYLKGIVMRVLRIY
ncbi:MAG: glycosyltransferase [Lachnospiraceae bacterium]|nr:glycosyltransferase [Lachnospiraceae bacterium]